MARPAQPGGLLAGVRTALGARVGFWRTIIEQTALSVLSLPLFVLHDVSDSPWVDLLSFATIVIVAYYAWRLEPGRGSWQRRGARIVAWLGLNTLIGGGLAWLVALASPNARGTMDVRLQVFDFTLLQTVSTALLTTTGVFVPIRVLLLVWALGGQRLRWQLTASYLLVGFLALLLMPVALASYIGAISVTVAPQQIAPLPAAERAATVVGPALARGAAPPELDRLLRALLDGTAELPMPANPSPADLRNPPGMDGVRRITVLDGSEPPVVLASAGVSPLAAGAALSKASAAEWQLLLSVARTGGCTAGRPADGLLPDLAVCGLRDASGRSLGILVVETDLSQPQQVFGTAIGRIVIATMLGINLTLPVLLIAFLAVLPVALGVAYWLGGRLTRRLEQLAAATGSLASGNLARRVEPDGADEIGRLSADFNAMADRLAAREQALTVEKERAERLLQANRRLVANVSHELRTPLTTLRGYLEALEQTHGDRLPAHDLRVIQGEIARLQALIDDLFTLARAEAQQLPLALAPTDATALVENMVARLAPLARRERQIELVARLAPDLPPVRADRARLEQVLLNLVQNAFRYTPPGGIVAIAGSADGDRVTLTVADTGLGIAAEELPLVWERFYRGDSSRAREMGGAGLGLALVKELIEAMGGQVAASSEPGRGSQFSVTLRRAEAADVDRVEHEEQRAIHPCFPPV
jgi:signal transduction histidine kinase